MTELKLKEQKEIVKNNFRSQLKLDDSWVIISSSWFKRWQKYVGYLDTSNRERSQEEIESFYPGVIENKDITLKDNELKKNLYEGIDYVYLPEFVGKYLHEIYGGDDLIIRKVSIRGTNYSKQLFIELYPIKIYIYLEKDISTLEKPEPIKILYESSSKSIDNALTDLYKAVELNGRDCRIWIKKTADNDNNNNSNSDTDDENNNNNSQISSQNDGNDAISFRKLTRDITDVDGDWRFLRYDSHQTLDDLNSSTITVMIEQIITNPTRHWPKDELLNEWKHNLRRGDMLDGKDQYGTWYESVVSSVNIHSNTVTIHFKGWSKKFDRELTKNQLNTELAPLYTRVTNWRDNLKIYEAIDYTKNTDNDQSRRWLPAYVMAIDNIKGEIKIKYREDNGVISEADHVDLYGESIAISKTHVKSNFPNFVTYPVTGSRATSSSSSSSSSITDYSVHSNTSSSSNYQNYSMNNSSTTNNYGYRYSNSWNSRSHNIGRPPEMGVVGLYNLGNTCFMNSMLQCLSNTKLLTDCFLNDTYATQLNTQNPLGHGGKVASSYARLMKEIWCGKYTVVSPDDFKRTIGEFAPQFSGFQQQDSQELMLFLLDGLHEDLNRILSKPFVEKIESKGRDDELISKEAWRRFLLRNDSELVDKCFGQLRSHVTCTNCQYQSVTFDEYSSLSLPLPVKTTVNIDVIVYPLPFGSIPIKLNVEVDPLLSVQDFKKIIISKLNLIPEFKNRKNNSESSDNNLSTDKIIDREIDPNGDFVIVSTNDDDNDNNNDDNKIKSKTNNDIEEYEADLAELSDHDENNIGNSKKSNDNNDNNEEESVGGSAVVINQQSSKKSRKSLDESDDENINLSNGEFFHICELGLTAGSGGRIMKTFEDRNTVKELSRLRDGCIMYELQNDAPSSLPYSVNINSSNQAVRYIDVLMGTLVQSRSQYTTYTSTFEITGPPRRYSYLLIGTVYGDIQEIIWTTMKTYLHPDSPYNSYTPNDTSKSECPYDIYLTNTYGSVSKGCVNAKYNDRFFVSNYEALICVWKSEALKEEHFNENILTLVKDETIKENNTKQKVGAINVMDCLNKFIEREQMPAEETWYCPNCKQHLAPIKKFDIWTAPDILIIHLKRFQYVPGVYFVHREKLSDLVDFPITGLDLKSYVKSSTSNSDIAPPIYDLYAVSEHIGGMGGGHYTATAMNPINHKWYNFNDSSTHEVAAEEAVSTKAYVLFYKRREGTLKWGGIIPLSEPLTD